jgi:hypothetical protein
MLHDCGLLKALLARLGIPVRFAFCQGDWRKKSPDKVPSNAQPITGRRVSEGKWATHTAEEICLFCIVSARINPNPTSDQRKEII